MVLERSVLLFEAERAAEREQTKSMCEAEEKGNINREIKDCSEGGPVLMESDLREDGNGIGLRSKEKEKRLKEGKQPGKITGTITSCLSSPVITL